MRSQVPREACSKSHQDSGHRKGACPLTPSPPPLSWVSLSMTMFSQGGGVFSVSQWDQREASLFPVRTCYRAKTPWMGTRVPSVECHDNDQFLSCLCPWDCTIVRLIFGNKFGLIQLHNYSEKCNIKFSQIWNVSHFEKLSWPVWMSSNPSSLAYT